MVLELPEKFKLYPGQVDAVQEIAYWLGSSFEDKKVVFLEAPTGSGKTVVAEAARIELEILGGLYVASTKALQDQFLRDFPYSRVLKGRSNYRTEHGPWPDVNCGDCTGSKENNKEDCNWCDGKQTCPYESAKTSALNAEVAVLNSSYWLTESNYVGTFAGRELVVIDEAHLLQRTLLNFVEWGVSEGMLNSLGLVPPKSGTRQTTVAEWLVSTLKPAIKANLKNVRGLDIRELRRANALQAVLDRVDEIAAEIQKETWVRDNKAGPLMYKPTDSSEWGHYIWANADKFLLMSATIISAKTMAEHLGLEDGQWAQVNMANTFPKENRPIYLFPVADMSKKGKDRGEWEKLPSILASLLALYPLSRILIHTVSYELSKMLASSLESSMLMAGRPILTYSSTGEKEEVLAKFKQTESAVLIASSMDTGVDLPGDMCEVQVIAKVPYPNLGDVQTGAMLHGKNGQQWYNMETVRTIVQMTGRGVRSTEDTCDTYILDAQFGYGPWKKSRGLFPEWWQEAIVKDFAVPEFKKLLEEL